MLKGKRQINENIGKADILIEIVDSRVPLSSLNTDIFSKVPNNKKIPQRIILLNKTDLSDPAVTDQWLNVFRKHGIKSFGTDTRRWNRGLNQLVKEMKMLFQEKQKLAPSRGVLRSVLHAMVVGIPNVGKSTLLNSLSSRGGIKKEEKRDIQSLRSIKNNRRKKARTGAMPGVTRAGFWLKISPGLEIFDTPGILFPKIESLDIGFKLALVGNIPDKVLDFQKVACRLLKLYTEMKPEEICSYLKVDSDFFSSVKLEEDFLGLLSGRFNSLQKGGISDTESLAARILSEFRKGRMPGISFEKPSDFTENHIESILKSHSSVFSGPDI
jgi:ribosome biogenesis GTPase A